jgi:hypothetical protein|tara:strand:+ start:2909 stop:3133 length:225 start_codon:yes stop_codon:yes gene_type:complete
MHFDGSPKVIGLGAKSEGLVVGGRLQPAAVPDEDDERMLHTAPRSRIVKCAFEELSANENPGPPDCQVDRHILN